MNHNVRIIGGKYRGKKLPVLTVDGLRPTPDRVKETLFNWLMHDIHNARCLDAFAGSGALGLEAFSRGATQVTLIERAPSAYQHLKKMIAQFASNQLTLLNTDALSYLTQCKEQFDIIFLDPPFASNLLLTCITLIETNQLLAPRGLLYIESPQVISMNNDYWQQLKLKKSGEVVYSLYGLKSK